VTAETETQRTDKTPSIVFFNCQCHCRSVGVERAAERAAERTLPTRCDPLSSPIPTTARPSFRPWPATARPRASRLMTLPRRARLERCSSWGPVPTGARHGCPAAQLECLLSVLWAAGYSGAANKALSERGGDARRPPAGLLRRPSASDPAETPLVVQAHASKLVQSFPRLRRRPSLHHRDQVAALSELKQLLRVSPASLGSRCSVQAHGPLQMHAAPSVVSRTNHPSERR
jgi:hypothetical protein